MRSEAQAAAAAGPERCRTAVEALKIEHRASPFGRVTVSMGIATLEPPKLDLADCLRHAEAHLYEAKRRRGRNTIVADALPPDTFIKAGAA